MHMFTTLATLKEGAPEPRVLRGKGGRGTLQQLILLTGDNTSFCFLLHLTTDRLQHAD